MRLTCKITILALLLPTCVISGICPAAARQTGKSVTLSDGIEFFEARVRPLLLEHCVSCHGSALQKGGLRLDAGAVGVIGNTEGAVIHPGNPDSSKLIQAVRYDGKLKMPPSGMLAAADVEALTKWVSIGAPWPQAPPASNSSSVSGLSRYAPDRLNLWSFRPARSPAIPAVRLKGWVKTPIDAFVLSRLEQKGLKPAPQTDRRTLIRRATFDLIGLPPTPEEVTAFLADSSQDAFARVVDRLLASPRYGERWARHWLDVVRYCDSADARGLGGEGDIGDAWRYRDWVVNAFNRDMPYSEFMMNQVAGDLLPAAPRGTSPSQHEPSAADLNIEGTIATGMLAIGNWGNGDADKEKILTDIADDQVDVVSRGFMGLTVACARCHDHKFDPIPTRDYYGLAGIFSSTHILPKLTPKGAGETPLRIPLLTAADTAQRDAYAAKVSEAEARLKSAIEAAYHDQATRLLPQTARYLVSAWDFATRPSDATGVTLTDFAIKRGLFPYALRQWVDYLGWADARLLSTSVSDLLGAKGVYAWKGAADTPSLTINTNDTARPILTFTLPPRSVCVHPGPSSGVGVVWKSPISGIVSLTGRVIDADPAGGDGIAWLLEKQGESGRITLATGDFPNGGKQDFGQGQGAERLRSIPIKSGELLRLIVLPKANYICDTTNVELEITDVASHKLWNLSRDLVSDPLQGNPRRDAYGNVGVWSYVDMGESSGSTHPGADLALSRWQRSLTAAAPGDSAAVVRAAQEFALSFTITDSHSPFWINHREDEGALALSRRRDLAAIDEQLADLRKAPPGPIPYANGAQEGGVPESSQAGFHDIRVHIRGSYLRLGDLVPRHFPVILAGNMQQPITRGSGRLELARWLASPAHPLTARVMVNRIWQHHFGEGIVRTPSNFGFLGERPTNPELLDWLARRFVDNGWSIKKMHRLMMLSATYQQSSRGSEQSLRVDPGNRLLSRMTRTRLEAESIRDSLLAVSGRLDDVMGGVATRDFNSTRRTLYVMTIRSDRTGFNSLFDAADSTSSIDRRTSSTVAPQALYLLNDPFVLSQAKALALRLFHDVPDSDAARIARAYDVLFARPVKPRESVVGLDFLKKMAIPSRPARAPLQPLTRGTDAGTARLSDIASIRTAVLLSNSNGSAEQSSQKAWEAYCQLLLCTNEFVFVD